ncbi:DUF3953 domain-containing protein [Paraliobacillus sediminis]|uniref:DUF3953 domain-containing protein n=1 Tax=Paraliobacillus sediminis TaxID=1885916 RepID=UPI001F087C45|nr:DUF3953 domain-containing protein [Paraliobacillus sediminis]
MLRLILSIIVVALSSYGLLTGIPGVIIPYALFFLGIMLLITGVIEFQKRNANAINSFLVAGFSLFVSIYILLS